MSSAHGIAALALEINAHGEAYAYSGCWRFVLADW
jgi:hypothetical protein